MKTKTLVVIGGGLRVSDRLFLSHGAEVPPGVLSESEVAKSLDRGQLEESGRRSYYEMFPHFSGPLAPR
jgi:hypothetical protein